MALKLLTRPDRLALVNALRLPAARPVLHGHLITVGCLLLAGVIVGGRFMKDPELLAALRSAPDSVTPLVLAAAVWLPALFALAVGLAEARAALFGEAGELLLVAPVPRRSIVLRAWLVSLTRLALLQLCLAWPGVWALVQEGGVGAGTALAYPLVALAVLAPLAALSLATAVLLRRFASGPRIRLAVNLLGGLGGIGLAMLGGAGFAAPVPDEQALAAWAAEPGPGLALLEAPGRWLAWTAGLRAPSGADLVLPALPLLVVPGLALAGGLLPAAWERGLTLRRRAAGRAARGGRRWPTTLGASVRRKDLLAQLREKAQLGGLGFFLAVTVLVTANADPAGHLGSDAPADVALFVGTLNTWLMLLMLLGCLQGGSLLEDEAAHVDLLAMAPIDRRRLLSAKLPGFALPHVAVLTAWMATTASVHGGGWAVAAAQLCVGLPTLLATLGVVLAVGTHPALNGPKGDDRTQIRRVMLVSGAVMALGFVSMKLGFALRSDIFHHLETPGRTVDPTTYAWTRGAALWAGGAALGVGGWLLARRHLEALLAPKR